MVTPCLKGMNCIENLDKEANDIIRAEPKNLDKHNKDFQDLEFS